MKRYVSVREILPPTLRPAEAGAGMAHAFVVLDSRVSGRNREVCDAFTRLPSLADVTDVRPADQPIQTFWPVLRSDVSSGDCKSLLRYYDFNTAGKIRRSYGIPNTKGPVLVAIDPSGNFFWIDMRKASDKKMLEVLQKWADIAVKGSGGSEVIKSTNIFAKFGDVICGQAPEVQKVALERVGRLDVSKMLAGFVKPFIMPVAQFVVGTTTALVCPRAGSTAT